MGAFRGALQQPFPASPVYPAVSARTQAVRSDFQIAMPSPLPRQKISTHTHKGTGAENLTAAEKLLSIPLKSTTQHCIIEFKETICKGNRRTVSPVLAGEPQRALPAPAAIAFTYCLFVCCHYKPDCHILQAPTPKISAFGALFLFSNIVCRLMCRIENSPVSGAMSAL